MPPTMARIYVELGVGLLLVTIASALWVHHDHVEQAKGATECQAKVTETQSKAENDATARALAYSLQQKEDQAKHDKALRNLPPTISTPVIVRLGGSVCPNAPGSLPQADDVHSNSSGDGQGPGERNIRPGLEAFKMRYGKSFLDCQQVLDDWPPGEKK